MGCRAFNSHRKIKEQSTSVEDNDNDDKIDKVLDPNLNLDIEEYSTQIEDTETDEKIEEIKKLQVSNHQEILSITGEIDRLVEALKDKVERQKNNFCRAKKVDVIYMQNMS